MSKLQEALEAAAPEEIEEVLAPFAPFDGVKTFKQLLAAFNRREVFMKTRLKEDEEKVKHSKLKEEMEKALKVMKDGGVEVKDVTSPIVEAYMALPEENRAEYIKSLQPAMRGSTGATPPLTEEQKKKAELSEEDKAEYRKAFPHPVKE